MGTRMIVIGTGPIGGIIGGRLARAGHDISFVDIDREHVAAIRKDGLQVDVPDGAFNVKVNIAFPEEIEGKYDMGLIAVRSNYTPDALRTVLPHLTDNGLLVSMQNGINPPLLAEKVGIDRTIGMAIRMGCRKVAPGHVQTASRDIFILAICTARPRRSLKTSSARSIQSWIRKSPTISSECSGASSLTPAWDTTAPSPTLRW